MSNEKDSAFEEYWNNFIPEPYTEPVEHHLLRTSDAKLLWQAACAHTEKRLLLSRVVFPSNEEINKYFLEVFRIRDFRVEHNSVVCETLKFYRDALKLQPISLENIKEVLSLAIGEFSAVCMQDNPKWVFPSEEAIRIADKYSEHMRKRLCGEGSK